MDPRLPSPVFLADNSRLNFFQSGSCLSVRKMLSLLVVVKLNGGGPLLSGHRISRPYFSG